MSIIKYKYGFFKSALVPFFDVGSYYVLAAVVTFCAGIALVAGELALYLAAGAYVGMCASAVSLDLAPAEMVISRSLADRICGTLNSSPNLTQISELVWAPKRYDSTLWKSSQISVKFAGNNLAIVAGRGRDLRLLILELDHVE